jgi:hypothetical protein
MIHRHPLFARLLRPELWERYNRWLLTLHPDIGEEVRDMAKTARRKFMIDMRPAVEELGLGEIIRQIGPKRLIEAVGPKRFIDEYGLDALLAHLTPAQVRELKRRLS